MKSVGTEDNDERIAIEKAAYEQMAKDIDREKEALEWAEATFGDSIHETEQISKV